jgi:hypothetical protein
VFVFEKDFTASLMHVKLAGNIQEYKAIQKKIIGKKHSSLLSISDSEKSFVTLTLGITKLFSS